MFLPKKSRDRLHEATNVDKWHLSKNQNAQEIREEDEKKRKRAKVVMFKFKEGFSEAVRRAARMKDFVLVDDPVVLDGPES